MAPTKTGSHTALLELALAGHGGLERFARASEVAVDMHGAGLVVRAKRFGWVPGDVRVTIATDRQRTVVSPYPQRGRRGVFEGDTVRVEAEDGTVLAERANPRPRLSSPRGLAYWDNLDFLYFMGYAMWGYLASPFVFAWPGFATREIEPAEQDGRRLRRLAVTYPEGFHAHCREQVFSFDDGGLLWRNDYTAEVFGSFAKSAHLCSAHRDFGGLVIP